MKLSIDCPLSFTSLEPPLRVGEIKNKSTHRLFNPQLFNNEIINIAYNNVTVIKLPINQSIDLLLWLDWSIDSINEVISQQTRWYNNTYVNTTNRTINRSVTQLINRPVSELVSQSVSQSISQSVRNSAIKSVSNVPCKFWTIITCN